MNIPLLCFMLQFVVLINIEVIRDIQSRGNRVSRTKAITLVSDQINTGPGPLNCSFLTCVVAFCLALTCIFIFSPLCSQ